MVVDFSDVSRINFATHDFCPNVLALKAVLILDLPGPQRRMANRQRAHRHRIIADMSLVGRHSPILSTGDNSQYGVTGFDALTVG
jgi:hypothetical protein